MSTSSSILRDLIIHALGTSASTIARGGRPDCSLEAENPALSFFSLDIRFERVQYAHNAGVTRFQPCFPISVFHSFHLSPRHRPHFPRRSTYELGLVRRFLTSQVES